MSKTKDFDIILWGATSFVGQIVAEYLWQRLGSNGELKWALAARNVEKLEEVRSTLGPGADELPILIGDSFDCDFLHDMASRTRVVLSTVGPYVKYGEPLVHACATQGTDYCDLTGEVLFIRRMRELYSEAAAKSGARIVNCAGFDSLPSDLGTYYLNSFCQEQLGTSLATVEMQVRGAKGGVSGGTIASALETAAQVRAEPALMKLLNDPYAVCPEGKRDGVRQPKLSAAKKSQYNQSWLYDFVMAPVNTKIVHASNALMDYPYGQDFTYSEWLSAANPVVAHLSRLAMLAMFLGLAFRPTRYLLTRFVLPKPGEGPNRAARESGHFKLLFHGTARDGQKVVAKVTGDADPGYGSTAKQISEVAIGLARLSPDTRSGGFWTPAACLGESLFEPLQEHAGLTFEAWSKRN